MSSVCLTVLAVLALVAVPAAAQQDGLTATEEIYKDYALDRSIDGHYDVADLRAALESAEGDRAFSEFADAVQEAYDRDILGLEAGSGPPGDGSAFLPEPRAPGERDQPPWPFLALTALAGALVVSGAGSSIVRRARR